jgi:hypothetical protein
MKYATPAAFRAARDQRLKTEAERTGIGLARLRKRIAFELFLRRVVKVAPSRWVLKGAFALHLRLDVATRPTNDIDIGRDDDTDAAIEDMTAAQQLDLGDFFSFAATRTSAFDETDEFTAVRFHVRAPDLRTVHRRHQLHLPNHLDPRHDHDVQPARIR